MSNAPTSPPTDQPDQPDTNARPRIQLSATQVIASALAAITATVAASFLGIAGTVIGAAVASVLTVTGNAVYSHSIQRTGERVITTWGTAVPAIARLAPRSTAPIPAGPRHTPRPARRPARRRRAWTIVAVSCVGVFAAVLLVVTGVELAAGRPLSDVVQGKPGSGTSLLGNTGGHSTKPKPTVTGTPTAVTATPTSTPESIPASTTATTSSTPASTPASTTVTTNPTSTTPTSSGSPSATPTVSAG